MGPECFKCSWPLVGINYLLKRQQVCYGCEDQVVMSIIRCLHIVSVTSKRAL